jgi:hypothetical protein
LGWPGPITWRQYLAWNAWFGIDLRRDDKYTNQGKRIALEVCRANVKPGTSLDLDDFGVKYKEPIPESQKVYLTEEQKAKIQRAKFLMASGGSAPDSSSGRKRSGKEEKDGGSGSGT